MNELAHKLKGEKLDSKPIQILESNILWRSDKSKEEIDSIIDEIKGAVDRVLKEFQGEDLCQFIEKEYAPTFYTNAKIIESKLANKIDLHAKITQKLLSKNNNPFLKNRLLKKAKQNMQNNIRKAKILDSKSTKNLQYYTTPSANPISIHRFKVDNKDWIKEYQNSIQPITCDRFYITPSWHANKATDKSLCTLIIDPSLSFGSGHHASTSMCISLLSPLNLKGKNMLDVGCGSGILSLVGAKLGANIYACDTDSYAIKQTEENFSKNALSYKKAWQGSITDIKNIDEIPKKYDCIVANIVSSVLILLKDSLISHLDNNATLVLSGILSEHESKIINAFSALELVEKRQIDEWIAVKFIKK